MSGKGSRSSRLTRLARHGLLPLQRAWLRSRVGRLVLEEVAGIPLVVLQDVFNPAVFRTTVPLIAAMSPHLGSDVRVLDVGTGSGVAAIHAALRGARVIAVDSNPEAVRCARINALLNHVETNVDVREGDLFAPVNDQRFDLVVCNPPFFAGSPQSLRDRSWRSDDFLERFAAGLGQVLAPEGKALVVFSSHGDESRLLATLAASGFESTAALVKDLATEVVTVYAFHGAASQNSTIRGETAASAAPPTRSTLAARPVPQELRSHGVGDA
jgi:release factor glutamine methyltransferase